MKPLQSLDVKNKTVLVRVDYNVAIEGSRVTEPKRIQATLPTLRHLLDQGAKIILISHLGRPKGAWNEKYSLKPVYEALQSIIHSEKVPAVKCSFWDKDFGHDGLGSAVSSMKNKEIMLLENLRFDPGEEKNDEVFAAKLARLGQVFVQEAFGAVHRAHASTSAVVKKLPTAAGFLIQKELEMLGGILNNPKKPFVVLLGGAKVSTKINAIGNLLEIGADKILIGGAMAYTFLKALGNEIGNSLVEENWVDKCRDLMNQPKYKGRIIVSSDCWQVPAWGKEAGPDPKKAKLSQGSNVDKGYSGVDIGPKTIEIFMRELAQAKTIFWNGPVGMMETKPFDKGSSELARAVAQCTKNGAVSVLGGGDTIYAVNIAGVPEESFTHVSTGGGATIEYLEGKKLPGLIS